VSCRVDRGVDLLALALLMPTLRDWFVICQRRVPAVRRLGVSMPAVTMRLQMTKQDMRKGRKTGWPVSANLSAVSQVWKETKALIGADLGVMSNPRPFSPAIFVGSLS
jgi:hypothetical protein